MQRLSKKQEKTLGYLILSTQYKYILKFIKSKNGKTDDKSLIDYYETGEISTKEPSPKKVILSEKKISVAIRRFDRFIHAKENDVINKKIKVPSDEMLRIWLNR